MKTIDYKTFVELISTQDCYFINSFDKAIIRSIVDNGKIRYFVKFKGEEEFEAKEGSGVIAKAFEEHTVITKEDYDSFWSNKIAD